MPFYFTLDFLTGKYALVFIKKAVTPPVGVPQYGILMAIPTIYL